MKINKYPDGTSYVEASYGAKEPLRVFKINSYEDLWHLNQLVDSLRNQHIIPMIVIPNLIDAQADKRFDDKQSSGLKLVIKQLASMDANFRIFHPHNPEVVEMGFEVLGKKVLIIDNEEFIRAVFDSLNMYETIEGTHYRGVENTVLLSSDAGGFKPLMKLADNLNWTGETYSAAKSRSYSEGETTLIQQIERRDFGGKDILIVDDICVYGGTFKGLATMLRGRNCGKLYLAVSHMTIQNHKTKDTVFEYFDKVFTTNSKYDEYFVPTLGGSIGGGYQPDNLEIIKMF